ncbi:cation:proton antiporter [Jannaschia sp. Os4]|uniref:monovalent cation:proton antiporter-2 (CPA2) family protein n=1 Tax=Jannaschia sp. Os4 TaxID=2807617 RepID=UPI00193A5CAE|nr:monovalent cation:proton antiporter-2 (CPA2) family protein [Jannaschia sp. Os4]MBM2577636.1 cation:proton antiporter [Jannaschia sp. Os4]
MEAALLQAAIYLAAATLCVPLSIRFGLGSVLGYLIAGVLIGPVLGLVGSETETLQHFAEIGVVMMLFVIGLELQPRTLWDMRAKLLGLGLGQVVATVAAVAAVAWALGTAPAEAVVLGMILALSSTAIVMQTLQEKDLDRTPGGRSAFSVLLAQDIAVIPMLALMPLLAVGQAAGDAHSDDHGPAMGDGGAMEMAEAASGWVDSLPGWGMALLTVAAVALIVVGGTFLTRPVFRYVGRARLREMLTVVSLLFVLGVAALMTLIGLSPALGAFLAGVVLANSEYRHELEADIEPFKGILLGLFFITVGAGIDFGTLAGAPLLVLGITVGLIALKAALLWGLATLFRLRGPDRQLFALGLAQAGEFGFVLTSVAVAAGALGGDLSRVVLLAIALSMLATPLLFILQGWLAERSKAAPGEAPADEIDARSRVIIAGVGRFGQVVQRMLTGAGIAPVVLDRDVETIELLRGFGVRTYMGDPTRAEVLAAAGLAEADVLVVALDDRADAVRLVRMALEANPDVTIVARAYDRVHVYELYRAGARLIVREMFDSSLRAGRYVLENVGFSETEAHEMEVAFYKHDRASLAELAELWEPGTPVAKNDAYRARARELNQTLENALLGRFGEDAAAAEATRD